MSIEDDFGALADTTRIKTPRAKGYEGRNGKPRSAAYLDGMLRRATVKSHINRRWDNPALKLRDFSKGDT